jgi:hypothetical protein
MRIAGGAPNGNLEVKEDRGQRTEFRYQKLADCRKEKATSPSENQKPVDNQNNIDVQAQAILF